MLVDIFNSDNYVEFNVTLANIIGLKSAIYCTELLNIFKKAKQKNKLVKDDYFKVDRKYIFKRTTLTIEEQLIIDGKLKDINLISKHKDDPDVINLNVLLLMSIIAEEDVKLISDIRKETRIAEKEEKKETKKQAMIRDLKDSIVCSNYELLTALRNWVDSICNNPKYGWLSKTAIKAFQDDLNNYTKGDLDLALSIVKIASIQGYRNCSYAINTYEANRNMIKNSGKQRISTKIRVTEQKRATKDSISTTEEF